MTIVRFTPRAERDLEEIWDFTARRWDPEQADTYIRAIVSAAEAVSAGVRIGRAVDHVRSGYRCIRSGSHLIFYRPAPVSGIDVIRVLYQRMDLGRHL